MPISFQCGNRLNFLKVVSAKQLIALNCKIGSKKCEKYLRSAVRAIHKDFIPLVLLPLNFAV